MPESLLTILKFLLLALVYLFFLRVLRAVWAEVHVQARAAPVTGGRPTVRERVPASNRPAGRLKVVEPSEQRGRSYGLSEEVTVGRAPGCHVRLEDTYASQLHARIFQRDGEFFVEDLGSTNGTYLNRRGTRNREKVAGALVLRPGDRLVVGKTVMEVTK